MVDTNVVVYAHDLDAGERHDRAAALIEELERTSRIVVSAQVLNEFYSTITRPHRKSPLTHDEAAAVVRELTTAWEVVPVSAAVTLRALDAIPRHGLSFWDALIWAAAKEGGVSVLYTEDFQHDRVVEGVRFVNPFLPAGT
jgi:predicted nucleic acid-binding protein